MSRVAIIVASWNGRHLLPFCLDSVRRQDEPDVEVILVDNGSTDGTSPWLARDHPRVRLVRLPENAGFAAATNAGIAATDRRLVLTLNNDCALEPSYVRRLADFLDGQPRAGACQGRVRVHGDPSVVDSLGIRFDAAWRAHQLDHGERDRPGRAPRPVAGVSACAAMYRRRALESVSTSTGGAPFDAGFFAYYEDVDLALRLTRAGWTSWLVPEVDCDHVGSATGVDGSFRKAFLLGRNYLLYLARDRGAAGLAAMAPRLAWGRLVRLVTLVRHPRRDLALFAGEVAAVPRLPGAILKGRRDRRRWPRREAAAPTVPPS